MSAATLSDDLAMALDPVMLAEAAGMYPDKWQRDVLRSTSRRILLNVTRQGGKSTTVSVLACHTAIYDPGSLTLILSPGERQSKETFKKVMRVYRELGRPVPADAETKLELELSNGSRIVALPGVEGTIRGYSDVRLLIVDEASRVPDTTMAAVRPMLAVSQGRLVALSTPWGKRGWWYEAHQQEEGWEKVRITAYDCPRISAEFLAQEKVDLGNLWFKSEYLCLFVDTIDQLFSSDLIDAAIDESLEPLWASATDATVGVEEEEGNQWVNSLW